MDEGTRARIRRAAAERPRATHGELAASLNVAEGEVLAALPEQAWPVAAARLPELVEAIRSWGRLRVVVRNRLAVAELFVDLATATEAKGVLTARVADGECHLPLQAARCAYFVVRPGHGRGLSRSVAFVDDRGDVLAKIFLWKTRDDPDYDAAQIARFEAAREALAGADTRECGTGSGKGGR